MRNFVNRLRAARKDTKGNVGIIFGLCLLPMIGFVGIGIDVSRALAAKTTLDASADAAALSAVTQAEATLFSSAGQGAGGTAAAIAAGQTAGQQIFAADAVGASRIIGGTPVPQVTITRSGQVLTGQVTYTTAMPTLFGHMFGQNTFTVSGASTAALTLPKYMNIAVAIDISQSMGLASTPAYMTQLQNLTGGCAFGCHVVEAGQSNPLPYEQLAHNANPPIQLRIDVIKDATKNMIQTAQSVQNGSPLIQFAIYTMDYQLNTLSAQSSDYTALLSAADGIDLGPNTSAGIGDSVFSTSMPQLAAAIPVSGDGSSVSSPQQFVFIMTDGVQDVYGGCTDTHCTAAFDPNYCAALKANNVTVGVIYTTYLAMPSEQTYLDLVAPFDSQLATNLQSCATPGWFYQATNASDIQSAVQALFAQATGRGVLTH